MISNYLLVAIRNLRRHRFFSILNIAGLTIGLTCSMLIFLWVENERSYDTTHSGNIYRITSRVAGVDMAVMPPPVAAQLPVLLPAVKRATSVRTTQGLFQVNDRVFDERQVCYADSNFLRLFNFPLVAGNPQTALSGVDGIVMTETTARRYFGTTDVIGRTLKINSDIIIRTLTVTGVLKDITSNNHLQFDILLPYALYQQTKDFLSAWDNYDVFTYIQTDTKNLSQLTTEITNIIRSNQPANSPVVSFSLQPLTAIHLHSGLLQLDVDNQGNIQHVRIFLLIAIFILGIACINFMNLATALSSQRAKEVGMRKAIGALRGQLFIQFIGESVMLSCISFVLAIVATSLLLPLFNQLFGTHLVLGNILAFMVIAVGTGILAGSYPAFFLSSFKPVQVLKGRMPAGGKSLSMRNGLVIFQFTVSTVLMVSTLVVYRQLQYIRNRSIGFDKEHLLYVQMPQTGDLADNTQALKGALDMQPGLTDYTITSQLPTYLSTGTDEINWPGREPGLQIIAPHFNVDPHFLQTFRMQLKAGRFFREGDQKVFVVNETALKMMHIAAEKAIGMPLTLNGKNGEIVGVVKDFNFKPVHKAIEPLVLKPNTFGGYLVIRVTPGNLSHTMDMVRDIFNKVYPDSPFTYNFIDKELDRLYISEQRMGKLFNIFSLFSILISCLGLFGLAAFTAQRRIKEISIRKVFGASEVNIVAMLSKDFLKLVGIALLVGFPIAGWIMSHWLDNFVYRTRLNWWIFAIAGAAAILIAFITVSYQSVTAARSNPKDTL
ncbi:ABC transporter permease [Chitinophaga sp.]|uniref:ABC transporter permease n=1 Tax=Chitinophaga sp. TaxID=1869181 RepID=UPI0031CF008B